MKLFIGNDDNAIAYKQIVVDHLQNKNMEVIDFGINDKDEQIYYADMTEQMCLALLESGEDSRGILICGTGVGVCISANKIPGIYAAVGHDLYAAQRHILSNNGNVICFGSLVIGPKSMLAILDEWLSLSYKMGPSEPKVQALRALEKKYID